MALKVTPARSAALIAASPEQLSKRSIQRANVWTSGLLRIAGPKDGLSHGNGVGDILEVKKLDPRPTALSTNINNRRIDPVCGRTRHQSNDNHMV